MHGVARQYQSAYLRRTWREGGKVRNETVANLSALPDHVIAGIESGLKGHQLVAANSRATVVRSLPHGHVAAVAGQAARLGLPGLLGPAPRMRDVALALVIARACSAGVEAGHDQVVAGHHSGLRPRRRPGRHR